MDLNVCLHDNRRKEVSVLWILECIMLQTRDLAFPGWFPRPQCSTPSLESELDCFPFGIPRGPRPRISSPDRTPWILDDAHNFAAGPWIIWTSNCSCYDLYPLGRCISTLLSMPGEPQFASLSVMLCIVACARLCLVLPRTDVMWISNFLKDLGENESRFFSQDMM